MTTGATGQLGLALPVQGELSGSWGNTVNNGITEYTNIAIAATLTLTGDGAVTLANTTGDASATNITATLTGAGTVTAQFAIVRVTGTLTVAKVVTAPSYSKTYVVDNAATGGIVTFKASGQTGVSVAVGEKCSVFYNGTDYVKVATSTGTVSSVSGTGTVNGITLTGTVTSSGSLTLGGTLANVSLATQVTGTLPIANGGTGQTGATAAFNALAPTTTQGDTIYFNGTNNVRLAKGTAGQALLMNSGATAPEWSTLPTGITAGKSIALAMIFGF